MTDEGRGGSSCGWLCSDERVLVKEGRREMRVDDERERIGWDEVDWVREEAGEGGGAGRDWGR